MVAQVESKRWFLVALLLLVALSWVALGLWSVSPWHAYMHHDALIHVDAAASAEYLLLLALFVAGWVLMIVAMMLPSSLPLVRLFIRMTSSRADHLRLALLLIAGYLAVWTLFGGAAHVGDLALHKLAHRVHWLEHNPWAISAGVLLVAGVYQFTPLKYACLQQCRSPMSFVAAHWTGQCERRNAFALGVRHGLFCVGCCWSLMLLMFIVSGANLAWMLVLGALMAVEKSGAPWARSVSPILGAALLLAGATIVVASVV